MTDLKNEDFKITLKDIKNNGLESKNTVEEITPLHSKTNNDDTHNTLKNNENFNIKSENVKLDDIRPRFRKCKELGCDKMYNCNEKIQTIFTNGGYTMDYFCKKKNTFVYWE